MYGPSPTSEFLSYPGAQSIIDYVWFRQNIIRWVNMALLTEGGLIAPRVYKHGPPDGGRPHCTEGSINIALLTEAGWLSDGVYKMALLTEGGQAQRVMVLW